MRRLLIAALFLVLTGCSSDPSSEPTPTEPRPTPTLSPTERLQAALLSESAVKSLGFNTINEGSRFDPTENTTYSLAAQCGVRLATDRRITEEWQSSYAQRTGSDAIDQVAVRYRGGAAAALAEVRTRWTCTRDKDDDGAARVRVTAPTVPGGFASCLRHVQDDSATCLMILVDGSYASAVTVEGPRLPTVSRAVTTLAPHLRAALAGKR